MDNLNKKTGIGCCLLPLLALLGLGTSVMGLVWLVKNSTGRTYGIGLLSIGLAILILTFVLFRRLNTALKKDLSFPSQSTTDEMLKKGFVLIPRAYFSDHLRNYLREIESTTKRTIRIFDRRTGDKIPKGMEMPNAGPPPFYMGNSYEIAIDVFATPSAYSKEEAESSIALLATQASQHFDGLPFVRFNPMGNFSPRGSASEVAADADPLQKWLSSAIMNILAEFEIINKGFSRRTTWEEGLKTLEIEIRGGPGYRLATQRGTLIYKAINLVHALLSLQEKLIPVDLAPQYHSIIEKLRSRNSEELGEALRIVNVLNHNHWKDPRNFKSCLLAVLKLWDIDEFVGFGHIDPDAGQIIDD